MARGESRKPAAGRTKARTDPALANDASIYEDAPIGLCVLDSRLRYVRVNRRFVELTGLPAAHFLGKSVMEIYPDVAPAFRKFRRLLATTGEPIRNIEFMRDTVTTPGVPRSWVAHWSPIKDPRGRLTGVNIAFDESTERDALLEALDRQHRRLVAVLEQLPVGAVIAEAPSGRIVLTNPAGARIFRHPFPEARNFGAYRKWKIFHPDGRRLAPEEYPLARAIQQGAIVTGEELVITRGDGTRGVISANATPIRDSRGRIVAGAVIFSEVTERYEALEALRASEAKFRRISENLPFGLGSYDGNGRVIFVNPMLTQLLGYTERDLPRVKDWFAALYPDPKYRRQVEARWSDDIEAVRRGELQRPPVREYRVVSRDGTVKTMEITFALEDQWTHAVFLDVTERKRSGEALREATEFMRAILELAPLPIYVRDAKHRYRLVNREWERLFRQKRADVIGKAITAVLPRKLANHLEKANREVLASESVVSAEEAMDFPDGRHIFHTVKFPLRNAEGKVDAVGGISIDLTDSIRANQEILRLKNELEVRVADRTAELAAANRELRDEIVVRQRLQHQLIEVSEREQRRLGEDLHDMLGQQLTALAMMAAVLELELRKEGLPGAEAVANFGSLLKESVDAARDLAKGFYPIVLEQGGLILALKNLAATTQSNSGVRCAVVHDAAFRFPEDAAIHLYRIAQEAVTNALKHSVPREIRIELTNVRRVSVLRIISDGRPFKEPRAPAPGLGLHIMRQRARLIGTDITFTRGAKGGCEVTCALAARAK